MTTPEVKVKTEAQRARTVRKRARYKANLRAAGRLPPLTADLLFRIERTKALKAGMSEAEAIAAGRDARKQFIRDRSAVL